MDSQNNEPVQSYQNIWTIIISVVATALIVSGAFMFFQKIQTDVLRQEIQTLKTQSDGIVAQNNNILHENENLNAQNRKLSQDLEDAKKISVIQTLPSQNIPIANNTELANTSSYLCTAQATATEIGRDVFPIDPKYKGIEFLGQLFTAFNCGRERLNNIFGVKGDNYTLGSSVFLKNTPSNSLTNTFKSIGYKCIDPEKSCKNWELWTTVKVIDLLKLEPFHENFEADDCTNCG
jgi:cell division protein FtsB